MALRDLRRRCPLIGLLAVAHAVDAEGERIAEELLRYAADGRWNAVGDQYERLLQTDPGGIPGELHRLGAQAARLEGELLLSAQRLQRVRVEDEAFEAARADLDVLHAGTGLVMVQVRDRDGFEALEMPFAPELRVAVEQATEAVRREGRFVGLLPVGRYTVDGTPLQVRPGTSWQVLHIPRGR